MAPGTERVRGAYKWWSLNDSWRNSSGLKINHKWKFLFQTKQIYSHWYYFGCARYQRSHLDKTACTQFNEQECGGPLFQSCRAYMYVISSDHAYFHAVIVKTEKWIKCNHSDAVCCSRTYQTVNVSKFCLVLEKELSLWSWNDKCFQIKEWQELTIIIIFF